MLLEYGIDHAAVHKQVLRVETVDKERPVLRGVCFRFFERESCAEEGEQDVTSVNGKSGINAF